MWYSQIHAIQRKAQRPYCDLPGRQCRIGGSVRVACTNVFPGRPSLMGVTATATWPASLLGGAVAVHGAWRTWATQIDRYIALTEFAWQKFIAGDLAADRIVVKPNLVYPDPRPGTGDGPW
jgi:hypothetical protein